MVAAGGLSGVATGFERGQDRVEVAAGERALVVADCVRLAQLWVRLEHGRAVRVPACQRPIAVVDPHLFEPSIGPLVGDDRHRKIDPPVLTAEVEDRLTNAAVLGPQEADFLNRGVAVLQPCLGGRRIGGERPLAFDAPTDRIVNLGFARERLNEGVGLAGQETGEVGHGVELLQPELVLEPRPRRRGEQLGNPGHARSFAQRNSTGLHRPTCSPRRMVDCPLGLSRTRSRRGGRV